VVERSARCNCSGTREKVHWASAPSPEGTSVRCLRYLSEVMTVGGSVSVPSCLWNSTTSLAPAYITTTLRPNTSTAGAILSTQHQRGFLLYHMPSPFEPCLVPSSTQLPLSQTASSVNSSQCPLIPPVLPGSMPRPRPLPSTRQPRRSCWLSVPLHPMPFDIVTPSPPNALPRSRQTLQ
jgi:hypothetical protein